MNIQGCFPLGLTGLISLLSKGLSGVFSSSTVWKHQFFSKPSLWTNSHPYMIIGKAIALTWQTSVDKVMSLFFNILSRFVTAFLPRSKCLFISWLQSPSAVILEPKKINCVIVSLSVCHEVMGPDAMILVFWMLCFKPAFSLHQEVHHLFSYFTFIRRFFSSSSLSTIMLMSSAYLSYFSCQSWFQLVIHPAQCFTWCTLHIKLNKQGDYIQPWCTPFLNNCVNFNSLK